MGFWITGLRLRVVLALVRTGGWLVGLVWGMRHIEVEVAWLLPYIEVGVGVAYHLKVI